MENALTPIVRSPGVIGAVVFGKNGECVIDHLVPPFEPILVAEILSQITEVNENYRVLEDDMVVVSTSLKFTNGYFLVRSMPSYSLIVITSEQVNLARIAITMNVAMIKLTKQEQKVARIPPPPPPPSLPNAMASIQFNTDNILTPLPPDLGVSGSSLGISLSGDWSKKQQCSKKAVGMKVMRHLLKIFVKYRGQQGLAILEQELNTIGVRPATMPASGFADLIHQLSRHIPDQNERTSFITKSLGD